MLIALYAEINFLCILITLILVWMMWRTNKSGPQRLMIAVFLSQALLFLFDLLWIFVDGKQEIPTLVNSAVNIVYYEMTAVSPLLWLSAQHLILTGKEYTKKSKWMISMPCAFLTVFLLISPATGSIFFVDEANAFHRGELYFIQPIIGYLYLAFAGAEALIFAKKAKTYAERKRAYTLAAFVVAPVLAALLQIVFPGLPLVCAGSTVSMIAVFMNLQMQLITQDTLTQMNNRFQLMNYLERRLDRLSGPDSDVTLVYVYMLDVDDFKKINDTFGHLEGDHALRLSADAIKRTCGKHSNCFCARFGGDEFSIIYDTPNPEMADQLEQEVRDAVAASETGADYSLCMSIGKTFCEKGMPEKPSAVLDRADDALYKDKMKHKKELR